MINARHLTVTFDEHKVLDDLTFEIKKGETVAIVGPNGSGKSTLIKTLLGLIPFAGEIAFFEKHLLPYKKYTANLKKYFTQVGYVPQKIDFDRTVPITVIELLSVYQNKKNTKKIIALLKEVGAQHLHQSLIGHLSGGEFQRVMLALALVNDPELLILDEATAGVDMEGENIIYDIVENLRQKHGLTVIFVSHDISLVFKYASQVMCLNHCLMCHGTPLEALTKEVIDKLYAPKPLPRDVHHPLKNQKSKISARGGSALG